VRLALLETCSNNPRLLHPGRSDIEGRGSAIFVALQRGPLKHESYKKAPREVIHLHETDGSLHFILSAADARLLVQKGWGERHGLNGKVGFPRGYLMVYAPRNESELDVIRSIIKAAARYALDGEKISGD
jgi:hypothetical protein